MVAQGGVAAKLLWSGRRGYRYRKRGAVAGRGQVACWSNGGFDFVECGMNCVYGFWSRIYRAQRARSQKQTGARHEDEGVVTRSRAMMIVRRRVTLAHVSPGPAIGETSHAAE